MVSHFMVYFITEYYDSWMNSVELRSKFTKLILMRTYIRIYALVGVSEQCLFRMSILIIFNMNVLMENVL